jgi:hypothetical protein
MPVGSLVTGTYAWRVKSPKFLANSGVVVLVGDLGTSLEIGQMRAEDCNNDNVVNSSDFIIMKGTFGKGVGSAGYDDRADLNGDQVVNSGDFGLLRTNFGAGGAPPVGPDR